MRRLVMGLKIGAVLALLLPTLSVLKPTVALALNNGVGATPTMGWNDWNAFQCNNNAADVEANATYVHDSGLQADGYGYIVNDGCWNDLVGVNPPAYPSGTAPPPEPDPGGSPLATLPTTSEEAACGVVNGRGTGTAGTSGLSVPAGQLFINPYLFPPSSLCANDGMARVSTYVHSLGLKFGLWLDASDNWNGEEIPGSYGWDQEDASTFASWGVDFIKADWSGNSAAPSNDPFPYGGTSFLNQSSQLAGLNNEQIAQTMYGALSHAVANTGRQIVLNLCVHDPLAFVQQWGAGVGNSWKSDQNLSDSFASMVSMVNDVDQYAQYAAPGGFNDPDMLTIGDGGMTQTEDQVTVSLWAEMAAPLIMGANMATPSDVTMAETQTGVTQLLPPATAAQEAYDLSIFGNTDVIAIDQDPLGKQGSIVSFDGTHLIPAKPLANGDSAVTLFNEGSTPAIMSTTASAIGLPSDAVYTLRDLWSKKTTETAGTISSFVAPHATVMYRVSAPKGAVNIVKALLLPVSATLSVSSADPVIAPSSVSPLVVSLTNSGRLPILVTNLGLQAPAGWSVAGSGMRPTILLTNRTQSATFTVNSPAASVPISTALMTGSATYKDVSGNESAASSLSIPFVAPVNASFKTADATSGPTPLFGQLGSSFAIDAAGSGITVAGFRPASDQYASIYEPGGAIERQRDGSGRRDQ